MLPPPHRWVITTSLSAILLASSSLSALCVQPASAATPAAETRAAFTCALANSLHLAPASVARTPFTDLGATAPSCRSEIAAAYVGGWVSGTGPHTFSPQASLTREQVAKMEVLALALGTAANGLGAYRPAFADAGRIGRWAWGDVDEAYKIGILNGFLNGDFGPAATFTPAQANDAVRQLVAYKNGKQASTTYVTPVHVPIETRLQAVYAVGTTMGVGVRVGVEDPPPTTSPYSDVSTWMGAYPYVWYAVNQGRWIPAATSSSFGAQEPVSHAMFASLAVAALGDDSQATALANQPSPFRDDARIPEDLRGAVDEAAVLGLITAGPNDVFAPTADTTVYQADQIIARMLALEAPSAQQGAVTRARFVDGLGLADGLQPYMRDNVTINQDIPDVPMSSPDFYLVEAAYHEGWLDGLITPDGNFSPSTPITLAQALEIADGAYQSLEGSGASAATLAALLTKAALPFSDQATLTGQERGYVAEAVLAGILPSSREALHADAPLAPSESATLLAAIQRLSLRHAEGAMTAGPPVYLSVGQPGPAPAECSSQQFCTGLSAEAFDRHGLPATGTITVSILTPKVLTSLAASNSPAGSSTTVQVPNGDQTIGVDTGTAGTGLIRVTAGTLTVTRTEEVYTPPLTLTITPKTPDVAPGGTLTLTASATDKTGRRIDIDPTWGTSPPGYVNGGSQLAWGTLVHGSNPASVAFQAGEEPGQGFVTATYGSGYGLSVASEQVTITSDVRKLEVKVSDATNPTRRIALPGDRLTVEVTALAADGQPAKGQDVVQFDDASIALQNGQATFTDMPGLTSPGTFMSSVTDASDPSVPSAPVQMLYVDEPSPGPQAGVRLFTPLDAPVYLPYTGQALVQPVDALGMPTTASGAGPQTIDLLTRNATFQQGGHPITSIVLPPGATNASTWLAAGSGPDTVTTIAAGPLSISGSADGKSIKRADFGSVVYTVLDGNGNPVADAPVTFTSGPATVAGSQSAACPLLVTTGLTGPQGTVQPFFKSVPTGDTGSACTLTASVDAFATSGMTTLTW